jgi:tetratricopeptide (TPR) repeat protein
VYRLAGDIGELAVPDSLHALLAARLDALDPAARRLVTDAAVLGSTFPAEALIAMSGQDENVVRALLADLVRREVLSVSADPLSPERGSFQFAQGMLRQVAYDTLSRRDRKTRHLTAAAHLRAAFPGDGEEVADVIARHYLDALEAVPEDADAARIRGQAATALIRAAERAERTGAPARAAASYAAAAELTRPDTLADHPTAGELWERAARAAVTSGEWAAAVQHADRAHDYHHGHDQDRAAARAQVIAGEALRQWGRHAEARERLTAAVEVLRAEPDPDTLRALEELAVVEVFAGSPDADRLSAEALTLGEALDVSAGQLDGLFLTRAWYLVNAGQRLQGVAYYRESARLATQTGDITHIGRALLNMADALAVTDPAAAAEAARTAVGHLRRAGARRYLAVAVMNVAQALLMLGDWDAAQAELTEAAEGLAGIDYIGHLAPMLRAERDLARARLAAAAEAAAAAEGVPAAAEGVPAAAEGVPAAAEGVPAAAEGVAAGAAAAFAAAIASLRERGTPYHLAHGLLDHAGYLTRRGDADAAALALEEARDIGDRLGCQPLLDRASQDSLGLSRA